MFCRLPTPNEWNTIASVSSFGGRHVLNVRHLFYFKYFKYKTHTINNTASSHSFGCNYIHIRVRLNMVLTDTCPQDKKRKKKSQNNKDISSADSENKINIWEHGYPLKNNNSGLNANQCKSITFLLFSPRWRSHFDQVQHIFRQRPRGSAAVWKPGISQCSWTADPARPWPWTDLYSPSVGKHVSVNQKCSAKKQACTHVLYMVWTFKVEILTLTWL